MECKFTIGDVVQLKSGGPKMTISEVQKSHLLTGEPVPFYGSVDTVWFENGAKKLGSFHQDMLEKFE